VLVDVRPGLFEGEGQAVKCAGQGTRSGLVLDAGAAP
jgi:hypothetical protein